MKQIILGEVDTAKYLSSDRCNYFPAELLDNGHIVTFVDNLGKNYIVSIPSDHNVCLKSIKGNIKSIFFRNQADLIRAFYKHGIFYLMND